MILLTKNLRLAAIQLNSNPETANALKTILNTPNWEKQIKEWFATHKQAGMGRSLAIPLAAAILLLSQATKATTPEEMISDVKKIEQQMNVIDSAKVDLVEKIIPFLVSPAELVALRTGTVPYIVFSKTFAKKIKRGLEETVMPFIKKDPILSLMDSTNQTTLITEAMMQKINHKPEEKGILEEYLKRKGKSLEDIEKIVSMTTKEYLRGIVL